MNAPATAAAPKPLLELSTLDPLDRPYITIDGARYDLMTPADFGLIGLNRLDQMRDKVDSMVARQTGDGPISETDAVELTTALGIVVGEILRAPAEVIEKLSDINRLAILGTFTPASRTAAPTKPNREARRRTGATSSRASRASTARSTG